MYHKSNGYRLTGGGLHFGTFPILAQKSQRDVPPPGFAPARLDSAALPPPLTTPISFDRREKHNGAIALDICGDSAKKVLKAAPLIPLEEAQRREASRRGRAADRALEKEVRIEREVSKLKREVAEIAWKKAQAKHDEENKTLEIVEKRKQEGGPMLTAAVAAREDGLVVAPTNWIVPLISLDEARYAERTRRDATETVPLPSQPPSAVTFVNSLAVNTGNGNTATLQLISLEEARGRHQTLRLKKDTVSRTRVSAHAGSGLSHVSLITLAEARKQDALRRNRSSHERASGSMSRSRKPSDALALQEKARWLTLMSDAENWRTQPNTVSAHRPYTNRYP